MSMYAHTSDADSAIRQTDTDAAGARLSAVQKGYLVDPYIRFFVPRAHLQTPRPPLINVGTYVRSTAIDGLVEEWLAECAQRGERTQIVSLGAGSDTRFWRVATGKYKDVLERYVEIDFAEVTGKKAMAIRKSRELSQVLGEGVRVANGGTALHAEKYHLLPCDLRLPVLGQLLAGDEQILSPSVPTLLLFECVLVYMEASCSEGILNWFVEYVSPHQTLLGGIVYEMFNVEDAFGKVMVNNLKARNVLLPGAREYGSIEKLPLRFLDRGFSKAWAETLKDAWDRIGGAGDEMLDEMEELGLVLSHYGLTWGVMGGSVWNWGQRAAPKNTETSQRED
ncbi:hypothetical protein H0H92_012455 [Tricholoma furcatifolium]|nr:hypothetical protein H0H92_012455 [Tricholoma furcatifolium]